MGGGHEVYILYYSEPEPESKEFLLLELMLPAYSNANENEYRLAWEQVEAAAERATSVGRWIRVGEMQTMPIGDELYECESGARLTLFYCHNTLNADYLILGTAENLQAFIEEATDEYASEVNSEAIHKIEVSFIKQ